MRNILIIFLYLFTSIVARSDLTTPPKSIESSYHSNHNKLKNPGAELGKVDWTASGGTFSIETTAANVFEGARSFSWDPSAGSQTFRSGLYSFPAYMNGYAICYIQTAATDLNFTVEDNSGNEEATYDVLPIANSEFKQAAVTFGTGDGSETFRISIESASDSAVAKIDSCKFGVLKIDEPFSNVSQASFVGSAYIAGTANCTWTRSSATLGAPGTDSDCPGPTVELNPGPGTIQTTDADLPQITVNNLPAGYYHVNVCAYIASNSGSPDSAIAISDGTTTSGQTGLGNLVTGYLSTCTTGTFSYSNSGNRTFALFVSSTGASQININNTNSNNQRMRWVITRFPIESQLAYTQDQANFGWIPDTALITNSAGLGTVTNEEVYKKRLGDTLIVRFSWNNGTVAPSTASIDISGLTMDTTKMSAQTNRQRVGGCTVLFDSGTGTTNTGSGDRADLFYDGSDTNTLFFSYQTASGQFTKVNGSTLFNTGRPLTCEFAVPISGWKDTNVPALLGSVMSKEGLLPKRILSSVLNCDASSAITENADGLVSSIGNISGGACAIVLNSSLYSGNPKCWVQDIDAIASTGLVFAVTASSTTAVSVDCELEGSTACTAYNFNFFCLGSK